MSSFQDPAIYRDILDGLQIGVCVLDLHKNIVFWSDGAEQITGYARIDVLGRSCTESILQHCNQTACEMCAEKCPMAVALHDCKPLETMSYIHHKAGYRSQVRAWAIPLRDKHGSIIGIIQTFEDEAPAHSPDRDDRRMDDRRIDDRRMKERGCLDDVTGLPNHAMMQSHLRDALGSFAEFDVPFGIVCLEVRDLDHFRARYGLGAARSIVQVLARTLKNTVWPTDFVCNWTDSRFVVVLTGCSEEALLSVGQRILRMMASATIMWWGEELSVSISIARTAAIRSDSVETLLQRVELALGANQVPQSRAAAAGVERS